MSTEQLELKNFIRTIPDFPSPGILFRDITPLLANPRALNLAIKKLAEPFQNTNVDYVAAAEARGFIFGSAVAHQLNAGFIPLRKPGKLPAQTESVTYDLEYGTETLQVHSDAITPGSKILMIDDLLATGGTMKAACRLIEKLKGTIVGLTFLIELTELKGRDVLKNYSIHTVISY